MYEKVTAKNFKGLDFDQSLGEKNLIIGPNGSGKSARTQALLLLRLGYVPGEKPKRKNADIMESFAVASEDAMIVGVTYKGETYERRFFQTKSGTVTQKYRIGGGSWNLSKTEFEVGISKLPIVLDLSTFTGLSDQKKIDHLFHLYPPKVGVGDLDRKIEEKEEERKAKANELAAANRLIADLEKSIAEIELPAGSLAEVQDKIATQQKAWKYCNQQLEQAKAELAAEEKAQVQKKKADEAPPENQERNVQASYPHNRYSGANSRPPEGYHERNQLGRPPEGQKQTEQTNLSDIAHMSPGMTKVANDVRALARASISDLIKIAYSVKALAVAIKGKQELKKFEPVEVKNPEQF